MRYKLDRRVNREGFRRLDKHCRQDMEYYYLVLDIEVINFKFFIEALWLCLLYQILKTLLL